MFISIALNGKVDTMVLTFSDSPKDPSVKQERTSDSSGKYNFETTLGTYL